MGKREDEVRQQHDQALRQRDRQARLKARREAAASLFASRDSLDEVHNMELAAARCVDRVELSGTAYELFQGALLAIYVDRRRSYARNAAGHSVRRTHPWPPQKKAVLKGLR